VVFDAKVYLANLSMHGPAGNLSELESEAVWTELRRRMNEPEPEKEAEPQDGTA
jgi:hypothetical protein